MQKINTRYIFILVFLTLALLVGGCGSGDEASPQQEQTKPPVIESITRTPEGIVSAGTSVTITAVVSDPEGDAVTVSWEASVGTLSSSTGASVNWTAPAGSGMAHITVTARDGGDVPAQQQVVIIWSDAGGAGNTNLKVTIRDNPVSNQPVADAIVAFYNTDNKTIATNGEITTGTDGIADFGDVGRTSGSLSVIHSTPEGGLDIHSFINVPLGEFVYYTAGEDLFYDVFYNLTWGCYLLPNTAINLDFTNIPVAATDINTKPRGGLASVATLPSSVSGFCAEHLQADGTLSLLATSLSYDATGARILHSYGYLLDQELVNGATYNIDLSRELTSMSYTTVPATPIAMSIEGTRDGVVYSLGSNSTDVASAGNVYLPMEFPVDKYTIFAIPSNTGESFLPQYVIKYKSSLALNEQLDMPNNSLTSLAYSATDGALTWSASGTSPVDFVSLWLHSGLGKDWIVFMPGDATSWQIMDLPASVAAMIDESDLTNTFCEAAAILNDTDSMNGLAEVFRMYTSSGGLADLVGQRNFARTDLPLRDCGDKPSPAGLMLQNPLTSRESVINVNPLERGVSISK